MVLPVVNSNHTVQLAADLENGEKVSDTREWLSPRAQRCPSKNTRLFLLSAHWSDHDQLRTE